MTAVARIREALKSPDGVGLQDGIALPNTITSTVRRLVDRGEAFAGKVGHKTVRYFDTQERAAAYVARTPKPPKWGVTIHGKPKFDPDAPLIFTSKTKYTICPPPPRALYTNTHNRY